MWGKRIFDCGAIATIAARVGAYGKRSNFAISHREARTPLTQCFTSVQTVMRSFAYFEQN